MFAHIVPVHELSPVEREIGIYECLLFRELLYILHYIRPVRAESRHYKEAAESFFGSFIIYDLEAHEALTAHEISAGKDPFERYVKYIEILLYLLRSVPHPVEQDGKAGSLNSFKSKPISHFLRYQDLLPTLF